MWYRPLRRAHNAPALVRSPLQTAAVAVMQQGSELELRNAGKLEHTNTHCIEWRHTKMNYHQIYKLIDPQADGSQRQTFWRRPQLSILAYPSVSIKLFDIPKRRKKMSYTRACLRPA